LSDTGVTKKGEKEDRHALRGKKFRKFAGSNSSRELSRGHSETISGKGGQARKKTMTWNLRTSRLGNRCGKLKFIAAKRKKVNQKAEGGAIGKRGKRSDRGLMSRMGPERP